MPSNTSYRPTKVSEFEATKLQYNPTGVRQVVTKNSDTNVDLYFTDDNLLTGLWIAGKNIADGDYLKLRIIDTDNIFEAGAGAMIKQFGKEIYLPENCDQHFDIAYPAKIVAGLTLRIVYHSVSTETDPTLLVNYKLHLVLS